MPLSDTAVTSYANWIEFGSKSDVLLNIYSDYILSDYIYVYICEGYQQQPIFMTQCFMGWTQSWGGSAI